MIDNRGYRLNVGIILVDDRNQVFWGERIKQPNAWQFPQGGINNYETLEEAMYRELYEELGLERQDVKLLGVTKRWLYYRLPPEFRRYYSRPLCIGQKQKWFLLRLLVRDEKINFMHTNSPEFIHWRWVNYWHPVKEVISFKRKVYSLALHELQPLLSL